MASAHREWMWVGLGLVASVMAGPLACGEGAVELTVRPPTVELVLEEKLIALAERFRAPGSRIAVLSCTAPDDCEQPPADSLIGFECVRNLCKPVAPHICMDMGTLRGSLNVVDLDTAEPDIEGLLGSVESVEIERLTYEITKNQVAVPLPALTLYFSPSTITRADARYVEVLGELGNIAPGQDVEQRAVTVVDGAREKLAKHFLEEERAIRFFACTDALDLEPGDAFPEGSLTLKVEIGVRLMGTGPR